MIVTAHSQADWDVFRYFAESNGYPQPAVMPRNIRVLGALNSDKELTAVIEFSSFCRRTCYLHIIGTLTPELLRAMFSYAFKDLGVVQLFGPISAKNTQLLKLAKWLGFEEIRRIECGWDEQTDIVFIGMHLMQCRWLKEKAYA